MHLELLERFNSSTHHQMQLFIVIRAIALSTSEISTLISIVKRMFAKQSTTQQSVFK